MFPNLGLGAARWHGFDCCVPSVPGGAAGVAAGAGAGGLCPRRGRAPMDGAAACLGRQSPAQESCVRGWRLRHGGSFPGAAGKRGGASGGPLRGRMCVAGAEGAGQGPPLPARGGGHWWGGGPLGAPPPPATAAAVPWCPTREGPPEWRPPPRQLGPPTAWRGGTCPCCRELQGPEGTLGGALRGGGPPWKNHGTRANKQGGPPTARTRRSFSFSGGAAAAAGRARRPPSYHPPPAAGFPHTPPDPVWGLKAVAAGAGPAPPCHWHGEPSAGTTCSPHPHYHPPRPRPTAAGGPPQCQHRGHATGASVSVGAGALDSPATAWRRGWCGARGRPEARGAAAAAVGGSVEQRPLFPRPPVGGPAW